MSWRISLSSLTLTFRSLNVCLHFCFTCARICKGTRKVKQECDCEYFINNDFHNKYMRITLEFILQLIGESFEFQKTFSFYFDYTMLKLLFSYTVDFF